MRARSFFSLLGVGVTILLTISAASLIWILSRGPLTLFNGGVLLEPTASVFIGKQAPLMVSLLVNPRKLEDFARLSAAPENRRYSHREIENLEKSLLANTGLNYQKEIAPWIGEEITLAVTSLDLDRDPDNGIRPGYLLAIETKDADRAKEFLQTSYSKQSLSGNFDLIFEPYKGINIIYQKPLKDAENNRLRASAVVGNIVLFSNDRKVLREALNNVQVDTLNLKNSVNYKTALKTITEPRIGIVYADIPALSAWIGNSPVPETPAANQQLALALSLKSGGLVADTALIGVNGDNDRTPLLSDISGTLSFIGEDSLIVASGRDLDGFWRNVQKGLEKNSPLQELVNQSLNRIQEPLGLKIPDEVFSWVKGEYSLALVNNSTGVQPDWIFVAERPDGVDVDSAVKHLDGIAVKQGYSLTELPLMDREVTAWTKLTTDKKRLNTIVAGVHTRVGNYEIIASSVEAMGLALTPDKVKLTDSQKFKGAISALPAENDGYLYLNWNDSQGAIEEKIPIVQVVEFTLKPFFNNLRSLTVSSTGSENGVRKATIFFNLGVRT